MFLSFVYPAVLAFSAVKIGFVSSFHTLRDIVFVSDLNLRASDFRPKAGELALFCIIDS
jgi:hypothetical protein